MKFLVKNSKTFMKKSEVPHCISPKTKNKSDTVQMIYKLKMKIYIY